jgi:hypothetical protein
MGFVVDRVTLGQVFPPNTSVFSVNFIPSVLHYTEKTKKQIIFITGLHSKPQGCGASVASAACPFTTKKKIIFSQASGQFLEPTRPSVQWVTKTLFHVAK